METYGLRAASGIQIQKVKQKFYHLLFSVTDFIKGSLSLCK